MPRDGRRSGPQPLLFSFFSGAPSAGRCAAINRAVFGAEHRTTCGTSEFLLYYSRTTARKKEYYLIIMHTVQATVVLHSTLASTKLQDLQFNASSKIHD